MQLYTWSEALVYPSAKHSQYIVPLAYKVVHDSM
jgi:hypothetical protein